MTRLTGIAAFRLTSADPDALVRFYADALGFAVGARGAIARDELRLLGVTGAGRRITLRLSAQQVDLDAFDARGRPYPADADAADPGFQHLAIVTSDPAAAWERARAHGATPISRGGVPITLPASTGGVTAFKFRDPEGHPLELLHFPAGASDWRGEGNLGIDHSAISVADARASCAFFAALGLAAATPTLNEGPTQAALDALDDVRVDVQPLRPERATPHLELLGYRVPAPCRAGVDPAANDIAATRTVWTADRDALIRDPDGHLHLLGR